MEKYVEYDGAGVYCIKNDATGKEYIGSSMDINVRLHQHFSQLKNGKHPIKDIQRDYDAGHSFSVSVLRKFPVKAPVDLMNEELEYIRKWKKNGTPLYNKACYHVNPYRSQREIERDIADMYCKEHFNMSSAQFFSVVKAQYNMMYEISINSENEEEIRNRYADSVYYENKDRYYTRVYGMHYSEYLEMKDKGLIREGENKNVNV